MSVLVRLRSLRPLHRSTRSIFSHLSLCAQLRTSVTDLSTRVSMENPHAERQNVLLQRIIKNADKCTEIILELNHCLEEMIHANAHVKTAADLVTKYRKNVQYNLQATRSSHS